MSAVEDVATAIAAMARAKQWGVYTDGRVLNVYYPMTANTFCRINCQDASQAKRLAAMMQQPPEPVRGVFGAMGIDPVDPMDRFPSVRGKA